MKSDQRADDGEALNAAFRLLFELSDAPAAVCDSQLQVIAANERFAQLCGVRALKGCQLDRVFPVRCLLVPENGGATESKATDCQGRRLRVMVARQGELLAVMLKAASDASEISENLQAERSLLKYLEELLEHANALIVATDREGKVRVCSKLFLSLTGREREEVLEKDLLGLIPEVERMRVAQVLATALSGERGSNFETRISGREGREARVSLATSPVFGADGQVDGMIAIGQDLSTLQELEHRIIHAEKLASMGRFAACVAHEINNPLTAVVSYADALLARSISNDSPDQEKLRKILDGCERILRFTRQLVSYARPSPDRLERVDVNGLLDTALSYCDHVLSHYGIAVDKAYQPMPQVLAIKGNLAQVFVNLITNACQAMQPGGALQLSTRQDGQDVVIHVTDNGAGMDSQTLAKVFEPFFTTKPDGSGNGLGLSIAQNIVESHGGKIAVQSSLGLGTTFVIRLPSSPPAQAILAGFTFDTQRAQSAAV
jgi:two-component system, NtrC family, sensor kinase